MVSTDLLKLAHAIAEFEGWRYGSKEGIGVEFASPSFNNHNPGNLRASPFEVGKRNNFSVFINDEIGFFALLWDLHQKATIKGPLKLGPDATIYELIKVYSGESAKIVSNYALFIERRTGLKATMKLKELVK